MQNIQIIAFAIADARSKRMAQYQVLPGLTIFLKEKAGQCTRQIIRNLVAILILPIVKSWPTLPKKSIFLKYNIIKQVNL